MRRALQRLACFLLAAPAMAAADQWVQARSVLRAMAPAGAEVVFAAPSGRTPGADRACHGALEHQVEGARLMPRMTVRFRCLGATGWTEVVSLGWHVYQSVLVTTRPLARQDSVNADTARFERRDLTTLGYGYITDISVLGHRFVARPLQAGVVLTPSMLLHQELVKTGDAVVVQSQAGGLVVRADGVALAGGDQGERVRVRSNSSGRILEAVVVGLGVVQAMP